MLLGGLPVVGALMVYGFVVNCFGHAAAVNTSWVVIAAAITTLAIPAVATVLGTVLGVGVGARIAAGMPLRQAVAKIRPLRI